MYQLNGALKSPIKWPKSKNRGFKAPPVYRCNLPLKLWPWAFRNLTRTRCQTPRSKSTANRYGPTIWETKIEGCLCRHLTNLGVLVMLMFLRRRIPERYRRSWSPSWIPEGKTILPLARWSKPGSRLAPCATGTSKDFNLCYLPQVLPPLRFSKRNKR